MQKLVSWSFHCYVGYLFIIADESAVVLYRWTVIFEGLHHLHHLPGERKGCVGGVSGENIDIAR